MTKMKKTIYFWPIVCLTLCFCLMACDKENINTGYGLAYSSGGGSSFAGHTGSGGSGGSGGGSNTANNSIIVGSWVYKDSSSNGYMERTYTFKANGQCHLKDVWVDGDKSDGDSSYTEENDYSYYVVLTSSNAGYVFINNYDYPFEVSGNTLTIRGIKYTKS